MRLTFRKRILCALLALIAVCAVGYSLNSIQSTQTAYALTLKQGSRGETVKTMQRKLKNWGYYTGSIDGIFGAKTKSAVIYFQRKNGLSPDGIVGKKTLAALSAHSLAKS